MFQYASNLIRYAQSVQYIFSVDTPLASQI
jgi:hypothetical protein